MAKILLVEDDNNLREIYEARLMAEGYEIVSARDGEEALAVAMKEKPDLVISDVMMPKISGFDMLDILRTTEETKNVKIIMMTALSQAEDKERAEKLGADRYLVKSQVTLEDVAKVAKDVLEGGSVNNITAPNTAEIAVPTTAPITSNNGFAEPVTNPIEEKAIAQQIESMMAQSAPPTTVTTDPAATTIVTTAPEPVTVIAEPAADPVVAAAPTPTVNPIPQTPVIDPFAAPAPAPVAEPTTDESAPRDVMEEITKKVIQPINDLSSDNGPKLDALAEAEEQNNPSMPAPDPFATVAPVPIETTNPVMPAEDTSAAITPTMPMTPTEPASSVIDPSPQPAQTPAEPAVDPNSIAL